MSNAFGRDRREAAAILLVDADPGFRAVLARSLQQQPDCDVVGQAGTLMGAVLEARYVQPDVVVVDATLPDATAAQVVREIRSRCPDAELLLVVDSASASSEVIEAGLIEQVVEKSAPVSSVVTAIRRLVDESLPRL